MDRRQRLIEAAAIVRQCRRDLAARDSSLIREVAGEAADGVDWRHYPAGEVYDPVCHAQYFYHRHPEPGGKPREGSPECGHFHLFLRGEGMPAGISPLLLPEAAVANVRLPRQSAPLRRGRSDEVCHLVAIAVDRLGEPVRLFTTNRWVTGETWYRADDVSRMLERFRPRGDHPWAIVDRWLGALVQLFEPEIAVLLHERDRAILERRWRWRSNVLEDPRLEITSSRDIDLEVRLATVEQSAAPAATAGASRAQRLPRMAEGWGA